MLYAREVIDLMGAHPGRDFRMRELYHHVSRGQDLDARRKRAIREGILRVVKLLSENGMVLIRPPKAQRGGYACYRWTVATRIEAE